MKFPELAYISWAKSQPSVEVNLARSGVTLCPASLLGLQASDLLTWLPASSGREPLIELIGKRYRVSPVQVLPLSGGTSYANWIACAALLDGCPRSAEVIVERPTYEPLLRIPQALGHRIRRLDRYGDDYAIDLDRFESLVSANTRLAIVSNLHNPSGARIDTATLQSMAEILGRVNAYMLIDEVYLECAFRGRTDSGLHVGPNVVTTSSLTKAYGLDGLRAGWILGPAEIIRRASQVNDLMAMNSVAPGEQMTLAAFRNLESIGRRARDILDPNLLRVQSFLQREPRLHAQPPAGGTVVFPRLPMEISGEKFSAHLIERYSTLIVPGRFFESPSYFRLSFSGDPTMLEHGLANVSSALDDLER